MIEEGNLPIEVPLIVASAVGLEIPQDTMSTPGALKSSPESISHIYLEWSGILLLPQFDHDGISSAWFIAPTVRASGEEAGDQFIASACESLDIV